ncbi:MAG TPA: protein-tyrosine-phosphatase [Stellaceae bacterium]|nr:protein-tyrosine-phosphatase [Stellaceae bacterium]
MTSASAFVPFKITVCGVAELSGHSAVGVTHVLSILDPGFPDPDAFGAFGEHERLDLRFHDITDAREGMRLAQREDVAALLQFGRDLAATPEAHLLVHCHMGISRSTAAMTLILAQARPDRPAQEAIAEVRRIRAQIWPNLRVVELGDALLGRNGELVAAAVARYRHVVERRPEIGRMMTEMGRSREVAAALAPPASVP